MVRLVKVSAVDPGVAFKSCDSVSNFQRCEDSSDAIFAAIRGFEGWRKADWRRHLLIRTIFVRKDSIEFIKIYLYQLRWVAIVER